MNVIRLFDAYVFVDWSAANRVGKPNAPNTIWVAEQTSSEQTITDRQPLTRQSAHQLVLDRLIEHVRNEHRVLVGFDVAYGYPAGLAESLHLDREKPPWRAVWEELARLVTDTDRNVNNRFAAASALNQRIGPPGSGPFWGCPRKAETPWFHTHRPDFPYDLGNGTGLERLRLCEQRLRGVQETWKLAYPGSVGGQTLTGIPWLHRLRTHPDLAATSRVWPFETGFTAAPTGPGPSIVHAEIWPGVVEADVQALLRDDPGLIRDQAQVRAMCTWARRLDEAGQLGRLFDPSARLTAEQAARCVDEEGWILGAA